MGKEYEVNVFKIFSILFKKGNKMKIYQRLEQIFKFRLYNNSEISSYLTKMSNMGKIDDVKKIALFNLILTKLGEMEDKETVVEYSINPQEKSIETNLFKCPDCDMVAKSKLGLISHSRKHKNVV